MSSSDNNPNRKRTLYDYSQSGDRHWYSGSDDPLQRQKDTEPEPEYKPDRTKSAVPTRQTRTRQRIERKQQLRVGTPQDNWAVIIVAGVFVAAAMIVLLIVLFALGGDGNGSSNAAANAIEPTSEVYEGEGAALDGNSLEIEPWDGDRFTVLLMGLDTRPDESPLQCRTDTILVISIDPATSSIGMLSIPRDTDVEVPGYQGLRPINTACTIGNLESPGHGPRLAMQTIQYNFGIPVNEYMIINFDAFKSLIDRIGGVNVYVEQTIHDEDYPDEFYGTEVFHIDEGWHQLDGDTALKYARSRHTTDDIDRGRRQQQLILAVRERVLDVGMVDDLALQSVSIWNDVNDGVDTSLSLNQMVELGLLAAEIDFAAINNAVLDWQYLRVYVDDDGDQFLVPDREKLPELMIQIFGPDYNG